MEIEDVTLDDLANTFDSDPVEPQQDNAEEPEEEPVEESEGEEEVEAEVVEEESLEAEEVEEEEGPEIAEVEPDEEVGKRYNLPDGDKVSIQELKDGYMRQQDYSRKTQELAEKDKAISEQAHKDQQQRLQVLEGLEQEIELFNPVGQLQRQLQDAIELGDTELANELRWSIADMEKRVSNIRAAKNWEKQSLDEQKAKADADAEEKSEAEMIDYINKERTSLLEKLPLVKDEKGKTKFKNAVAQALKSVGYTEEEMAELGQKPDHRQAILAYKAAKYDEMQASQPKVAQKLKKKAVTPKPSGRTAPKTVKGDAYSKLDENPNNKDAFAELFA